MLRQSIVGAATIAVLSAPLATPAAAIPAASYYHRVDSTAGYGPPGTYSSGGDVVVLGNSPSPYASARAATGGAAYGDLQYSFSVNSLYAGSIPLDIAYNASTSTTSGVAYSTASSEIDLFIAGTLLGAPDRIYLPGGVASQSGTLKVNTPTNTDDGIELIVNASSSAYAYADPYISIDPQFFVDNPSYSPSDFSLAFSTLDSQNNPVTIGNSPSSPIDEPSALACMAAALLGLFGARRCIGSERG